MSHKPNSVAQSVAGTSRHLLVAVVIFFGLQAAVAFAQGSAIGDQLLKQLGQVLQGAIQPKPEPQQAPPTQPQAPLAQSVPPMSKRKANQAAAAVPSSTVVPGGIVDDQWFGKWKSGPSYSFEISAKRFRYTELVGDEGIYKKRSVNCKWSPAQDALRHIGDTGGCQFSDSQRMKSKAELVRSFQDVFRRYPGSDSSDKAAQAKKLSDLEMMKPGPHKVFILNNGNDVTELIFDGEHLFQIEDRDMYSVSVYTRSPVGGHR